ncbi:MAG: ISL3 family transposase [Clostridia bacterium]|nr:ISL3 family transposase [Clostridia bacterium]
MYSTGNRVHNSSADFPNMLLLPNNLADFVNNGTAEEMTSAGGKAYCFHGDLYFDRDNYRCDCCDCRMEIHNTYHVQLRHICIGDHVSFVLLDKHQFICPNCGRTEMQQIPFQAEHHRITVELLAYTENLLSMGYTNKEVSGLTGLHQGVVKSIDKARLQRLYTEDGKTFRKPEKKSSHLAIDEFKLHDGYKFATHIIDLDNGHILWIQEGKKKQVVYDFIDFVGEEWMAGVEAVACDMNSDFQEAFEERCPDIQIVYDHFHIIKNFNEKVISQIRKDEQKRLLEAGDIQGAKTLKGSKYILTSKRSTLQKKDQEASEGKIIQKGNELFGLSEIKQPGGNEARYDELLKQNKLLFTADLVQEMLSKAFQRDSETDMANDLDEIIDTCMATGNAHFQWFARLIENHYEGIMAHASLKISSGKIEGINNKIKVIRNQAYGIPDDEYFFLKVMDASRRTYTRNPQSHKLLH